jgi:hypothetical protein
MQIFRIRQSQNSDIGVCIIRNYAASINRVGSPMSSYGASSSLPRVPAKVNLQTDLPTFALAPQPFLSQRLKVIAASR